MTIHLNHLTYLEVLTDMQRYPTRNGVGISPFELGLPESDLDLSREQNWNNHHNGWEARAFGSLALLQTFRDLERHQFLMPVDQHDTLHRLYSPPAMPTIEQAMNIVVEAHDAGERLRTGSARNPVFKSLTKDVLRRVSNDYSLLRSA